MKILWEPQSSALWHRDCTGGRPGSGIVRQLRDQPEKKRTVVMCCSCDLVGFVPHGMRRNTETVIRDLDGWHIKNNPKPIPDRRNDYDFWHDEQDIGAGLNGTAASFIEAVGLIEEIIADREDKS